MNVVLRKFLSFLSAFMRSWEVAKVKGMQFGQARAGSGMIGKIIGLSVGVFIMVFTVPPAITELYNVTVTTWGTAVGTLFTVLVPLLIIIAVVVIILKYAGINISL